MACVLQLRKVKERERERRVDLQISGRHIDVTDAMKNRIRKHVEKLPRFDDQIEFVEVTVGLDSGLHTTEVITKCHRSKLIAEAKGHDMYDCIEEAFEKMERQIARFHDKIIDRTARAARQAAQNNRRPPE